MNSRWCPHDDIPESCPPCNRENPDQRPQRADTRLGPTFKARYAGTCALICNEPVAKGQWVRFVHHGEAKYLHHTGCAKEAVGR